MHLSSSQPAPSRLDEPSAASQLSAGHQVSPGKIPIGFIIRRLRELKRVTQSQLAAQSAINLSHVCTVESGFNNISIRKLLLICNALQIPPALLMAMQQNVTASAALEPGVYTDGAGWPEPPFSELEYEAGVGEAVPQTESAEPAYSPALPGESDLLPDAGRA
jgi:transcriptional regulator with XRE-family HTH domain